MEATTHKNPFLHPYDTPHDTVPFDKITLADYEEAMMEGIRREKEELEIVINDPAEPTFENTLDRDDDPEDNKHYYDLLGRTTSVFYNMLSAETNDDMDELAQKMSPILTKHGNDISLNEKMFKRVKAVYDSHPQLTPEQQKLLEDSYQGFVRSGALLDEEGKQRLRQLTEEASLLSLQFSQNLLKEKKEFSLHVTDEAQLEGLPDSSIADAREAADEKGVDGWVITLDAPSYGPFMMYSSQRELRRQLYMAYNTLCIKDNDSNNLKICQRLINLRRELAQLLGYDTYADYVMEHRMATTTDNVYKLLHSLIDAYKPTAEKERQELRDFVAANYADDLDKDPETGKPVIEPWDLAYYSQKLKLEKYDLDPEMLRPYLELNNVIRGVFGLATRLYGITFKENSAIPVYHNDVKAYEVFDRDGSYLAVLYVDFHPRKGKQGGAWMTEFQGQYIEKDGENVRPHASLVMNLSKPSEESPALLRLGEVETFLHEFGHSLHGMFANTHYEALRLFRSAPPPCLPS